MSVIENAAKAHRNVFIVYILFLVGTVFLSVFVWITSNKYQDTIKSDADARISTANALSEKAKVEAAKANERVKELEEKNLNFQAEVARLQIKAAEAEKNLLELQERLRPRHLTKEQKKQLIKILSKAPKGEIAITCVASNGEAINFAKEIYDVLNALKWKAEINIALANPQPLGLKLLIRTEHSPSFISAENLRQAFNQIGFEVTGGLDNTLPEHIVGLLVGEKP